MLSAFDWSSKVLRRAVAAPRQFRTMRLQIRVLETGCCHVRMFRRTDTVGQVKRNMRISIPETSLRMFFNGNELQDAREMQWYHMVDGSTVQVCDARKLSVYVEIEAGRTILVPAAASLPIGSLKRAVQSHVRVALHCFCLTRGTVMLMDDRTLSDYNIQHEDTLQYRLRTLGGSMPAAAEHEIDDVEVVSISSSNDRLLHPPDEEASESDDASETDATASADSLEAWSDSDVSGAAQLFNHRRLRAQVEDRSQTPSDSQLTTVRYEHSPTASEHESQATTLRYVRSPTPSDDEAVLAPPLKRVCLDTSGAMQIFVRTLSGKTVKLWIYTCDSVGTIVSMIHAMTGIPPDQQRLIFNGKQLETNRSVGSYGVTEGDQMHLLVRIRGGGKRARADEEEFEDFGIEQELANIFDGDGAFAEPPMELLAAAEVVQFEPPALQWASSSRACDTKCPLTPVGIMLVIPKSFQNQKQTFRPDLSE